MIIADLQHLSRPIAELRSLPGNPRRGDVDAVMRSYNQFGQRKPIVARPDGTVIAGNHQLEAAKRLGWTEIAVVTVDDDDLTAKAYALADNRTADLGSYDYQDLARLIQEVSIEPDLLLAAGFSDTLPQYSDPLGAPSAMPDGGEAERPTDTAERPSIADRFIIPPFTVLDARSGLWQERKRRWLSLGIRSEEGRTGNLLGMSETVLNAGLTLQSLSARIPDYYNQKTAVESVIGKSLSNSEFESEYLVIPDGHDTLSKGGTSIFDPVLTELIYRWWSAPDALILDPFAGGSVRGVVAGALGRRYVGIDLRPEQVDANKEQHREICPNADVQWICGDSREVLSSDDAPDEVDLVFSCPPYADLEVYSDDPADISTMEIAQFIEAYRDIIRQSVDRLRNDRFAVIVIGDARDKRGMYYNLIGETVRAFADAGCGFYNEAVLVTSVGSLPIRIGRIFPAGRKLGKTHQNVLVFVKGDPMKAAQNCGQIEVELPDFMTEAEDDDLSQ